MNLLIALRASRGWVSRKTLMSAIDGYAGLDEVAFDRKFSRDKDLLRHMGITIATRAEHDAYGDVGETGYRISTDDYAMDDIDLTPAEAAAVTVAAAFWSETELGESSAQALTKLRALGIDLDEAGTGRIDPGSAARRLASTNFADALHHINAREAIGFRYHKPGQTIRKVRLEPFGLLSRGDRVYLFGFDLDRQARRTFRLSRVEGGIAKLGGREPGDYEIPEDFSAESALASSSEMAVVAEAKLRIRAHRADPLRRRSVGSDDDAVIIEFSDVDTLAAEIVGFGDAVEALEPPELVRAVQRRRETVRDALNRLGGASVLSA
jgi:proteasome accessory factor B